MTYLLDTNVVSEMHPKRRAEAVVRWFGSVEADALSVSVLTIGELVHGLERRRRKDPGSARALELWLRPVIEGFAKRTLPVTRTIAERFGHLGIPDPLPKIDALIAATALEHGLVVVTRNVKHFERAGAQVIDPWEYEG